jgi:LPS-assembly lipoprotein
MKNIAMQSYQSVLKRRTSWLILLTLVVSACGFQLRGMAELSFKNLYIQGATLSISRDLKQSLKTNGIQVVENAESAELLLELLNEINEKRILSLSGGGLVREYELNYRVNFRTREPASPLWSSVHTVQVRRDFSYDDKVLLGKAEEEARLNTDMRKDAVREVLRRLTAIKPAVKELQQ